MLCFLGQPTIYQIVGCYWDFTDGRRDLNGYFQRDGTLTQLNCFNRCQAMVGRTDVIEFI